MARIAELLAAVGVWAHEEPGVRAAFLLGSHARTEMPADEWSDVDIVILADDPRALVDDVRWIERFGTPELTFVEETAVGGERERRVLYDDGTEVDFAVFAAAAAPALLADPAAGNAIARGYRILHDDLGLEDAFAGLHVVEEPRPDPGDVAADFWYHALWAAKKLRRGEAITARNCVERTLKGLLLALGREHAIRRGVADTWHRDRFVERWADPRVVAALWTSAATADELGSVLVGLCNTFDALAGELGLSPSAVRARLAELLP